jgi:ubiquinone/menaquinone biosynthesis C-methylase UbiE
VRKGENMENATRNLKGRAKSAASRAINTSLGKRAIQGIPAPRDRIKHEAELSYWRGQLELLHAWFVDGTSDWWGLPPVPPGKKLEPSDIWITNAVLTMHQVRPTYHEELQVERAEFKGERVLEIGCGPLAPILQFDDCERHGIDPLLDRYIEAGWPLYDYDAQLLNVRGENLPYPDNWFGSVISVNVLDHVDDFQAVAKEMIRVLRPGGRIIFEVEYHHEPTLTEPIALDDRVIGDAFGSIDIAKIRELSAQQLFRNLTERFGLRDNIADQIDSGQRWVLWNGVKR